MRPGATHKGAVERVLINLRAHIGTALDALRGESDSDEEGGGKVDVEEAKAALERADQSVRALQMEVGGVRLRHNLFAVGLDHETGLHEDTRNWLLSTFTEEDLDPASSQDHTLQMLPSRGSGKRGSHGQQRRSLLMGRAASHGGDDSPSQERDMDETEGAEFLLAIPGALESPEIQALIERSGCFDFDAISFCKDKELVPKPLVLLGAKFRRATGAVEELSEAAPEFRCAGFEDRWLRYVGKTNSQYGDADYHSAPHAVDVMSTTEYLLRTRYVSARLSKLDCFIAVTGAAIHDVGHPGKNNLFMSKTMSPLALRYNDRSILENMHVALSFETMRAYSHLNWFALLPKTAAGVSGGDLHNLQQYVRRALIEMVLATDMAKHGKSLEDLHTYVGDKEDDVLIPAPGERRQSLTPEQLKRSVERKMVMLQFMLHAADISNPTKPRPVMLNWARLVLTEFWQQGDEERGMGLDISPLCDREAGRKSVPGGQVGFINFVVQPYWTPIVQCFSPCLGEAMDTLAANKAWWQSKAAENSSYEDIFADDK